MRNGFDKHIKKFVDIGHEEYIPKEKNIILYRILGNLNYINVFSHLKLIRKHSRTYDVIFVSFRYISFVDNEALERLQEFIQESYESKVCLVIFCSVKDSFLDQMKLFPFFNILEKNNQITKAIRRNTFFSNDSVIKIVK